MYSKDLSKDEKEKIDDYIFNSVNESLKDYLNIIINNKIIGSVLITDLKEGKLLDEIYLEKEFRNTGIGTDIIREMLEKNRNIYLWVYKENEKAISLYKRLGFIIVDETDSRYYLFYTFNFKVKIL